MVPFSSSVSIFHFYASVKCFLSVIVPVRISILNCVIFFHGVSAAMITSVRELSIALFKANTFKFGTFTLPTGHTVNAYFDLTIVFSIPSLLVSYRNAELFQRYTLQKE